MANPEEIDEMPERRLVIIGARGHGKSSAANTILTEERFEPSRTQTLQAEARHGIVEGRNLVLVDTPGWKWLSHFNKQQIKLYASKCQPGPHAFLLVVPTDASFSHEEKKAVLDYMKLLGNRVWSYTMVLFTFGDYLGNKTIEQHIKSKGGALTWLVGECNNRYHVLNNKDKSNISQVTQLLEKIDDMVRENNDGYYVLDDSVFHARAEVSKKAKQRHEQALKQQEELNKIVSEMKPIQKLQIILLGSRGVGKTSVMNTILGIQEQEDKTTVLSQLHEGRVGRMEIAVVDTPGWRKGSSAHDTPKRIKDEVVQSLLKCHPGPDVFLLVIDADASFNRRHLEAATTHVELFGKNVWKHTMVVFTRGDWLGSRSIEEYIEGEEGEYLQDLLEICGNRYHVLDSMNEYDGAQVDKLLEKILQTLALNGGQHFAPKQEMLDALREKDKKVQLAVQRRIQLKATRGVKGPTKKLHKIKILMLGEKKSGKTTAANLILRDKVFSTQPNHGCMARQAPVANRQVTVVDTPGWAEESQCTWEQDREIVSGLTLSPQGVHAVLIVLSLDLKFRKANHDALVDHIMLFGDKIWNHTMVLFTNENTLADKSLEEYIEKEDQALRQLVDKCGNNYHCLNILETGDYTQHVQLFMKIEDMSAKNQGRLFCPNMNDIYRSINEKFRKRFKSQMLELLRDHKTKLEKLQDNIEEIVPSPVAQNEAKKTSVLSDIEEQIEELGRNIMKLNKLKRSMDDLRPTMSQSTPEMDKVLEWMSQLQGNTDDYNSMLNMSESSGYRSPPVFALDD